MINQQCLQSYWNDSGVHISIATCTIKSQNEAGDNIVSARILIYLHRNTASSQDNIILIYLTLMLHSLSNF